MDELSDDLAAFGLIICLYAIYRANSNNDEPPKKKRQIWVNPWIERTEFGLHNNFMNCYQDTEYILKVCLAKKIIDLKIY